MSDRRYCTFHVDRLLLGIDVERVVEVLRDQVITPVPLSHHDVAGLLSLRGQIVTAIDGRGRLGLTERNDGIAPTIVVVRCEGEAVSLLVDREGDVVTLDEQHIEALPDTVAARISDLCLGAHQVEGNVLLLLLDPDKSLAVAN
jgi:purine-binding chemotaxis protein CheW